MRTLEFKQSFDVSELVDALVDAGAQRGWTLDQILKARRECEVGPDVELKCAIDEEDAVDFLGDEAILRIAGDLGMDDENGFDIEDAVRYLREGNGPLAHAMFARVFKGEGLNAVERALA